MATEDIKTFFDDCQIDTCDDVQSAIIAFDYLAGKIRCHFETLLTDENQGIKDWQKRGVQPIWEEIVRLIVERSANTYQDDPNREILLDNGDIDPDKTALYAEMLQATGLNAYINGFDESRRLGGASLVLVQYEEEINAIIPSILSRNLCDVKWNPRTRTMDELIYTADACGTNGGRMYHVWTPEFVKDIEKGGSGGTDHVTTTRHDYGMIPVAYAWDTNPPTTGFWPKARWEQLTYANDAINMFHTQTKYAARFQSFPALFSDSEIPEGQVIGPDTIVTLKSLPGETPFIEYKAPTAVRQSLAGFSEWLNGFKKDVANQWGVNLRVDGNANADSGFKLVVEEFPSLELRNKRIKSAIPFEHQLHTVYAKVSETHGLDDITGDFRVAFKPPRLPVNDKEQWEIAQGKLATGVWTKEDFWRYENPDITDEEILERHTRVEAARVAATVARAPVFPVTDDGT